MDGRSNANTSGQKEIIIEPYFCDCSQKSTNVINYGLPGTIYVLSGSLNIPSFNVMTISGISRTFKGIRNDSFYSFTFNATETENALLAMGVPLSDFEDGNYFVQFAAITRAYKTGPLFPATNTLRRLEYFVLQDGHIVEFRSRYNSSGEKDTSGGNATVITNTDSSTALKYSYIFPMIFIKLEDFQ